MKNINMDETVKRACAIIEELERQVMQAEKSYHLEEDESIRIANLLQITMNKGSLDALKTIKFYYSLQGSKIK